MGGWPYLTAGQAAGLLLQRLVAPFRVCRGCGYRWSQCRELWPQQRKCCPDCSPGHVA